MPLIFYTCAVLCFLVALKQARNLRSTPAHLTFFISLSAAVSLVGFQLLSSGKLAEIPHVFMLINVFPLLAIQCLYFYACYLVDIGFTIRSKHMIIVAGIAAIYLAILTPYWLLSGFEKAEIIRQIAQGHSLYSMHDPKLFGTSVLQISNIYFGVAAIIAFFFACRLILPHAFRGGNLKRPVFFTGVFYLICLANAISSTVSVVIDSFALLVVGGFIMGIAFSGLYFIGEYFPWAIYESKANQAPVEESGNATERRSYLKEEDGVRIGKMIAVAMDDKKIFTDPDLSLITMSAAVGVSPHQLSEYLNRRLNKRFTKFINEYRIREAVRLIQANPSEILRAVGRAAGFQNDAYFSDVFLSEMGMRPSDYREQRQFATKNSDSPLNFPTSL